LKYVNVLGFIYISVTNDTVTFVKNSHNY